MEIINCIARFTVNEIEAKNPPYILRCDDCGTPLEQDNGVIYPVFDYYPDPDRLNCGEPVYLYYLLCAGCGEKRLASKKYNFVNENKNLFDSIDRFLECYFGKY
ncbi:MAG: hypothetical protein M1276_00485 [Deltaproteobacteria bacterium]|jgi:hypothetical protein|nr:hypothetical protein [Deltaproteobacteria bacterium]